MAPLVVWMALQIAVSFFVAVAVVESAAPTSQSVLGKVHEPALENLDEIFLAEGSDAGLQQPMGIALEASESNGKVLTNSSNSLSAAVEDLKAESGASLSELKVDSEKSTTDLSDASMALHVTKSINPTLAGGGVGDQNAMGLNEALDEVQRFEKPKKVDPSSSSSSSASSTSSSSSSTTDSSTSSTADSTSSNSSPSTTDTAAYDKLEKARQDQTNQLRLGMTAITEKMTQLQNLMQKAQDTGTDAIKSAKEYAKARNQMEPLRKEIHAKIRGFKNAVEVYHQETKAQIVKEGEFMKGLKAAESLPQISESGSTEGLPPKEEDNDVITDTVGGNSESALQKGGYSMHDLEDLEGAVEEEKRRADEAEKTKLRREDPLEQLLSEPQESIRDYSHSTSFGTTLIQLTSESNASSGDHSMNQSPSKVGEGLDEFSIDAPLPRGNLGFMAPDARHVKEKTYEGESSAQQHSKTVYASQRTQTMVAAKPHSMEQESEEGDLEENAKAPPTISESSSQTSDSATHDEENNDASSGSRSGDGSDGEEYFKETMRILDHEFAPTIADTTVAVAEMAEGSKESIANAQKFSKEARHIIPLRDSMNREVSKTQVQLKDFVRSVAQNIKGNVDNQDFEREVESRLSTGESALQNGGAGQTAESTQSRENPEQNVASSRRKAAKIASSLTNMDWKAMEQMSEKSQREKEQEAQWTREVLQKTY